MSNPNPIPANLVLSLTRLDLNRASQDLPLDEITWQNLKSESLQLFRKSAHVVFTDGGEQRVMKSRKGWTEWAPDEPCSDMKSDATMAAFTLPPLSNVDQMLRDQILPTELQHASDNMSRMQMLAEVLLPDGCSLTFRLNRGTGCLHPQMRIENTDGRYTTVHVATEEEVRTEMEKFFETKLPITTSDEQH